MKRIALAIMAGAYVLAAAYMEAHDHSADGLWIIAAIMGSLSMSPLAKD